MEGSVIPAGAGLPPKPMSALDTPLSSGNNPRRGSRSGVAQATGPPPPPPPDAKEDPRAAAGKRISYHDMDLVAEVSDLLLLLVPFVTAFVVGRCGIIVLD